MTEAFDPAAIDVDDAVKLVASATDEQLAEVMSSPQSEQIIAEVFRQMQERFKGGGNAPDAILHWKITGRPDGGEDQWTVKVADGKCETKQGLEGDARVTLTIDGPNFMRLVTGAAAGPMLFIAGKLKMEGDIPFAAQIQSLFEIPSA
jgi:putative sterol carrier protein